MADEGVPDRDLVEEGERAEERQVVEVEIVTGVDAEAEGVGELRQFASTLMPCLRQARLLNTWSGLRPGSFDGLPYLGAVAGYEGLYLAAGHFRSGLYLSPGTAVVVAQLMLGEATCIDLTPFSVIRG